MIEESIQIDSSSVLVLGATFKENCPDTRNSKVKDLINNLKLRVQNIDIYDPWIEENEFCDIPILSSLDSDEKYDSIIIAVPHRHFIDLGVQFIKSKLKEKSILFDLKGIFPKKYTNARL